jgi:septal ring factor EnvC (AmiA/AmiB activator)
MDIEKTMQFILDTQARLEATASQHDERLTKLETSLARLETSVSTVTDLVGRLAQAEIRLVERMDRLAESQAHTDQRLGVLIDVVDKLVRRNGSPG